MGATSRTSTLLRKAIAIMVSLAMALTMTPSSAWAVMGGTDSGSGGDANFASASLP